MGRSRRVRPAHGHGPGTAPIVDRDELAAQEVSLREVGHAAVRPHEAGPVALVGLGRLAGNTAVAGLMTASSAAAVQRSEWGRDYRTRRARPGALTYEQYKDSIGQPGEAESFAPPLKDASEWGGHRVDPVKLTYKELSGILKPEKPGDPAEVAAHEERLVDYLQHINTAFEAMGIDTVEAQSDYLAHAAGESGTLAKLTEVIDTKREYGQFIGRGPVHVTWESGYVQTLAYLEERAEEMDRQLAERGWTPPAPAPENAAGEEPAAGTEPETAAAEPGTAAAETPAPSTEMSPEDADAAARASEDTAELARQASLAHDAVAAIKADPAEAANPRYAFLFSAAYMHWTRGVKGSRTIGGARADAPLPAASAPFTGAGPEDRWVSGRATPWQATGGGRDLDSVRARAKIKKETYERGVAVLSAKIVRPPAEAGETAAEGS